jgi:tetratricopeptide (TPR) repeat protein
VSHAPRAALEMAYLRAKKVWQESRGKSIIALNSMAALRNLQGQYDDAISNYKALVAIDPKDAVAQNNLAYLVSAIQGKHDEALRILDRAKESVGPLPALLDTEGQICIAKGDFAKAISLLEDVNAMEPSGSHYFHLAEAYSRSGKEFEAKAAWKRAIKLDLQQSDLHPLEQDQFKRLQSTIGAATK